MKCFIYLLVLDGDSCSIKEDITGDNTIQSSQDSFYLNDDSTSSMEIDMSLIEKVSFLFVLDQILEQIINTEEFILIKISLLCNFCLFLFF